MDDVSFTLLDATLKKETGNSINVDRDYFSLNLDNCDGFITNAGLLLCDQGLLKQSRFFCTRWKGTVKGLIEGDAIDDKEYTGSIISLLENEEIELIDKLKKTEPFYKNDIHFILKEIKEILFSKENYYINYLNHPRISH